MITIDIDASSEKYICPKCCSALVDILPPWEAAEQGISVQNMNATFYKCNNCGTIWHEE